MMFLDEDDGVFWYSIQDVNPEPWESPESSVGRKGGKIFVQHHSSRRMVAYQQSVKEEFVKQNPNFLNMGATPIRVSFYLHRQVPIVELSNGNKRQGKFVDATNCQKALEDALQGILYKNDTNNVSVSTHLTQSVDVKPFILISVDLDITEPSVVIVMRERLTAPEPTLTESLAWDVSDGIF